MYHDVHDYVLYSIYYDGQHVIIAKNQDEIVLASLRTEFLHMEIFVIEERYGSNGSLSMNNRDLNLIIILFSVK
jgi:hypothetical protein